LVGSWGDKLPAFEKGFQWMMHEETKENPFAP
jgi:hypothetical protein